MRTRWRMQCHLLLCFDTLVLFSEAPHKPVGRSASMVPLSQRSMDPDKHKKPSEKPPEWRSKSLAAVSAPASEAFPDLPDGVFCCHAHHYRASQYLPTLTRHPNSSTLTLPRA